MKKLNNPFKQFQDAVNNPFKQFQNAVNNPFKLFQDAVNNPFKLFQDAVILETRHGVTRAQLKTLVEKSDKDRNGFIDR